jgi:CsoR family transcriptional regulator, copper-sensing transcriptional repressor
VGTNNEEFQTMSTIPAQHIDVVKKAAISARLKSIEGQARGIERMLEEDRNCLEIIDQLAALRGATQAVCLQALETFAAHCLGEQGTDREQVLAQVLGAISRLTR